MRMASASSVQRIATSTGPKISSRAKRQSLAGLANNNGNGSNAPPLRDQITLDLGPLGSATYVRDLSGPQPRVLRGAIGVGLSNGEFAPMPSQGVAANINQGKLDVDAWDDVLTRATAAESTARSAGATRTSPATPPS